MDDELVNLENDGWFKDFMKYFKDLKEDTFKDKNGKEIKVGQKIKSFYSIGTVVEYKGKLAIKFDFMPDAVEIIIRNPEHLEAVE